MKPKTEFRCKGCGKMLANTNGDTDIVCPRCGGMNKLNIDTKQITFITREMRRAASPRTRRNN